MKSLALTIAAVAAVALPALASPALAGSREPVTINVQTSDLDLKTRAGVDALRDRLFEASWDACNPRDRFAVNMIPDQKCQRNMMAQANARLAVLEQAIEHRVASK